MRKSLNINLEDYAISRTNFAEIAEEGGIIDIQGIRRAYCRIHDHEVGSNPENCWACVGYIKELLGDICG